MATNISVCIAKKNDILLSSNSVHITLTWYFSKFLEFIEKSASVLHYIYCLRTWSLTCYSFNVNDGFLAGGGGLA